MNALAEGIALAQNAMESFTKMWQELGVPIAIHRQMVHQLLITCVGLVIDTVRMIVKIPEDKFEKLEFGISLILNSKKI
jgi:hypothetical protein